MERAEYFEQAKEAIIDADEELVEELLEKSAADGITTVEMLKEGFSKGMEELGEQFAAGDVFLPELIMSAQAMSVVTDKMEEEAEAAGGKAESKGTVVIGTVLDDVHDIGKSICAAMLKASGFEVYDLGKQVPLENFIAKAKEVDADIIGSSALLTSTMEHQITIENLLKEEGLKGKIKTMVGGAPVNQEWADKIGADGFSHDASECCVVAEELVSE